MKKLLFVLACLLFLLSACSSANNYGQDDLSLYDTETKKQIRLGMTKDEIEETMNITLEPPSSPPYYYEAPGISIGFRDGTAVVFMLNKSEQDGENSDSSRFRTGRGITLDSSYEDFLKKYPESVRNANLIQLHLLQDGDSLSNITQDYVDSPSDYLGKEYVSSVYQIFFGNNSSKTKASPTHLYIGDLGAIILAALDK